MQIQGGIGEVGKRRNENLQGHPPELSDSVKLLLSDAMRNGFEIDHVLKSID